MSYTTAALLATSLVISAVGTGMSVYSQQQAADNSQAMANWNYGVQQQNAKIQAAAAQQQARWQQDIARSKQQAANNNAAALNDQARATEAQAREQGRRMREQNERDMATQRARYGKSNVTSEGSPLVVFSTTKGLMELAAQDMFYKGEMEARSLDRQADQQKYEGQYAQFDEQIAKYDEAAAQAGFSISMNEARVQQASGMADADGYRLSSYGTLLSGAGSMLDTASGYKWGSGSGSFKKAKSTAMKGAVT